MKLCFFLILVAAAIHFAQGFGDHIVPITVNTESHLADGPTIFPDDPTITFVVELPLPVIRTAKCYLNATDGHSITQSKKLKFEWNCGINPRQNENYRRIYDHFCEYGHHNPVLNIIQAIAEQPFQCQKPSKPNMIQPSFNFSDTSYSTQPLGLEGKALFAVAGSRWKGLV